MRIGVDVTSLENGSKNRGIGTYTRGLLHGLSIVDQSNTYFLFHGRTPPEFLWSLPDNFHPVPVPTPRLRRFSSLISHQCILPGLLRSCRVDLFHHMAVSPDPTAPGIPMFRATKLIVSQHDVSPLLFPTEFLSNPARRWFYWAMVKGLQNANHLICSSENSKRDIIRILGVPASRVTRVYLSANPAIPYRAGDLRAAEGSGEDRFFLHVGGGHPNKNLDRVLQAFASVRSDSSTPCRLVVVGPLAGYRLSRSAVQMLQDGALTLMEDVERHLLADLYERCTALVFPSLYEGFGLPPLEAMRCGTPVITSNTTSLPEVVGDAALLVNPYSASSIAEAMLRVLEDDHLRCELSRKGRERAAEFSWENTARSTVRVYEDVVS